MSLISYIKTVWQDRIINGLGQLVQAGTPVNAERLNKIEQGIYDVTAEVLALENSLENKIINGNLDIWQRGTSFVNPTGVTFLADRLSVSVNPDSGTYPGITISKAAITPGDILQSLFSMRLTTDGAGVGLGTNSAYFYQHKIEHGTRLLAGLNKKITLSFFARSSIANKKLGIRVTQNYGTGGSPSAAELIQGRYITLTSTWQKFTHTFTLNTLAGKTFGTNNDDLLNIMIVSAWGQTTGNVWFGYNTAEDFIGAGTIDIAQIQVNGGGVDLPFQPKGFDEELKACQRYYEKSYNHADAPGTSTSIGAINCQAISGYYLYNGMNYFKVAKRVTPTIIIYSTSTGAANKFRDANAAADREASTSYAGEKSFLAYDSTNGLIANNQHVYQWTADAEL